MTSLVKYLYHLSFSENINLYLGKTILANMITLTTKMAAYIIRAITSGINNEIPFMSPPPKNPQSKLRYNGYMHKSLIHGRTIFQFCQSMQPVYKQV